MSLVSSILSLGASQLGLPGLPGQFAKGFEFSFVETLQLVIQFIVFGLGAWYLRQAASQIPAYLESYLIPSTYITGSAVKWLSVYVIRNPEVLKQLRDRHLHAEEENSRGPSKREYSYASYWDGFEQKSSTGTWVKDGVSVGIAPLSEQRITMSFKGKRIWLTRSQQDRRAETDLGLHWRAQTWFWNRGVLDDLLIAACRHSHTKLDSELHVYTHANPDVRSPWDGPIKRPARNWRSVILPPEAKQNVLNDVETFLSNEEREWYAEKGIPHRRGYLLHGPPGAGKTTLVTALASKLRLDMYCLNPGAPGMDNDKLNLLFRACPRRSLILIEDIDCIMSTERRRSVPSLDLDDSSGSAAPSKKSPPSSSVTLSGILNAIDGITSQESSVLFASTNHPEHLDEALLRPGRFDVHVNFTYAKRAEVAAIYKHFYASSPNANELGAPDKNAVSSAGLDQAAAEFADAVIQPNINVSIAAIQGFLLLYKRDRAMAQEKVGEWVEQLREKQQFESPK